MRIVWDVTPLAVPPTGIGRYLREALAAAARLAPDEEWVAVSLAGRGGTRRIDRHLGPLPAVIRRRRLVVPGARVWRTLVNRAPLPLLEPLAGSADVAVGTEWLHPRQRRGLHVSIVHDLIPLRFPEHATSASIRMHAAKLDDVRRSDLVCCNSAATARDVAELLGVRPERLVVARPGVADRFWRAAPAADPPAGDRPAIVSICTLEPRKNLVGLVEAFARLRRRRPEAALVLVGATGWGGDPVAERTRALGLEPHVVRTGYLSDERVAEVLAGARAFCLPSLFEGFGMPVPEAMAAGVPVVASSHPSLDEAAGEAALRADPQDADALADALESAAFDEALRPRLIAAGRAHAATLTWERCGRAFVDAFRLHVPGAGR